MTQWIPALQTDVRRTMLAHVPLQQRQDPVFLRMAEAVKSGSTLHVEIPLNLALPENRRR